MWESPNCLIYTFVPPSCGGQHKNWFWIFARAFIVEVNKSLSLLLPLSLSSCCRAFHQSVPCVCTKLAYVICYQVFFSCCCLLLGVCACVVIIVIYLFSYFSLFLSLSLYCLVCMVCAAVVTYFIWLFSIRLISIVSFTTHIHTSHVCLRTLRSPVHICTIFMWHIEHDE